MGNLQMNSISRLIFEAGNLKRIRRSGWSICGVKDAETVAEHSWRTALIALLLAALEGGDSGRAVTLAIVHDLRETRSGDLARPARRYLPNEAGTKITADQVAGTGEEITRQLVALVEHFDSSDTIESVCARDADKLECLAQALEYQQQGVNNLEEMIDHCHKQLTTKSARRLAAEMASMPITEWYSQLFEEIEAAP